MASGQSYFDNKWLSAKQLHEDDDPNLQTALNAIHSRTRRFARRITRRPQIELVWVSCWAIVSQPEMVGRPHSHEGDISGVWYAEIGDTGTHGGEIVFHGDKERIWTPKNNQLLVFPSRTVHSVKSYTSETPRVVLPFNFRISS